MKAVSVVILSVLVPSLLWANITVLPQKIGASCGIKFAEPSVNPDSVEIMPESGEGSTEIDHGQFDFPLVQNANGIAVYQVKNLKVFKRGAPSYQFDVTFTLPLGKFHPGNDNFGASIHDTQMSYVVRNSSGKVVGQGQTPKQTTSVFTNDGLNEITGISYYNDTGTNAVFSTGTRNGIFNCLFQY